MQTAVGKIEAITAPRTTWTHLLLCIGIALLPLFCWPGLQRPFSVPKLWLVAALDVVIFATTLFAPSRDGAISASRLDTADVLCLAWLAGVSLSTLLGTFASLESLLLAILPLPLFWFARRTSPEPLLYSVILASWLLSLIAVLQYAHLDPLLWLGCHPETFASPRMRVYGTLGNPNFVAAWCSATLPFAWVITSESARSWRIRTLVAAGTALQLAAIFATGSRVLILALAVQVLLLLRASATRVWLWLIVAVGAVIAVVLFSPARGITTTLQGRSYLATISASHGRDVPLAGHGPGSFETQFARWQLDRTKAAPADPAVSRFGGDVDHAHNDYIEFFVEYGPAGLVLFTVLCGYIVFRCWRSLDSPAHLAASSGVLALLAIALVDFPFHRPAEWSLFWLLAGILTRRTRNLKETEVCRTAHHA